MAWLDHMTELQPFEVARQMLEEAGEVVAIEFLEGRILPGIKALEEDA